MSLHCSHKVVLHLLVWAELAMFAVDGQCEGGGERKWKKVIALLWLLSCLRLLGIKIRRCSP